jgi:predicted molibdopterin-dependent oxidoreductase YjgC
MADARLPPVLVDHRPSIIFRVHKIMPDVTISLTIDGRAVRVPEGTSVAVAVMTARAPGFRRSVTGRLRGPLCGMGICYECRLTIDGLPQRTSCQTPCRSGMEVLTDAP